MMARASWQRQRLELCYDAALTLQTRQVPDYFTKKTPGSGRLAAPVGHPK
jgi:hypothetical protein